MNGSALERTFDLGSTKAMQMLDSELRAQGVEAQTREQKVTLWRMTLEFIRYAIAQGNEVTDTKAVVRQRHDQLWRRDQGFSGNGGESTYSCSLEQVLSKGVLR